jgi:hypothetical protein
MTTRYWAFISYSHQDTAVAEWLHKALETYRVPRRLVGRSSRDGRVPGRLYPVFRDRDELPGSSNLGDNITSALEQSRYLIVICSPRAATSRWVNEEVTAFKRLGREDRILCLIVDGEPNAADRSGDAAAECFPEAVRYGVDGAGRPTTERKEPIAADLRPHADGRANAKLKVLAGLLGVGFDELKQRELQRRRRRRLVLTVQGAAALLAVLATYGVLADSGISVPGAASVRALLDARNASLLRPVHSDDRVRQAADELSQEMIRQIFDKGSRGQFRRANGNYDLWSTGQALTAVLHSRHTAIDDRRRAAVLLGEAFDNDRAIEANGMKFGWLIQNVDHSLAEPTLWTMAALGNALGHAGLVPGGSRARYERMLRYVVETTPVFYPIDDGGWNTFPRQVDASLHSDYSSSLALLALLHLRAAGVGEPVSAARRDALIAKTSAWLVSRHVEHPTHPGWVGNRTMGGVPLEGLSLQIYATLLRARAEAGVPVPETYYGEVYQHLQRMNNRSFSPNHISAGFQISFIPHGGQRVNTNYPIKFLWYPWAIASATQWLTHARAAGEDPTRITRVRRALGYLVVDLKQAAIDESRTEWPWVSAEILYAVSDLTSARP